MIRPLPAFDSDSKGEAGSISRDVKLKSNCLKEEIMVVLLRGIVVVSGLLLFFTGGLASAQTIVDEWATIKAPPAPELKPVTIGNPKETALLMLDFVKQICSPQARPRCVASLP